MAMAAGHHVLASLRLTPIPTTANEMRYIYRTLGKLAAIDFFRMRRDKSHSKLFSNPLQVLFNVEEKGKYTPFEAISMGQSHLDIAQEALVQYIHQICGLPRYQHIYNDQRYAAGEIEVPFKYQLTRQGLKYDKKITVSASTATSPFCLLGTSASDIKNFEDYRNFKANIRFNFEKFTKFEVESIKTGEDALAALRKHK